MSLAGGRSSPLACRHPSPAHTEGSLPGPAVACCLQGCSPEASEGAVSGASSGSAGPQGPGLGWPCLTLRDGLRASLRGAPAFASKPERCRVALGERMDLLGYSQGLHSRETGIGHRAVSEGSGRAWRARPPSLLPGIPAPRWEAGDPCAQVTGHTPPAPASQWTQQWA